MGAPDRAVVLISDFHVLATPASRNRKRASMARDGGPLDWTCVRDATPSEPLGGDWSRKGGCTAESTGRGSPKPRKLCVGAGEADGVTFAALRAAFGTFGAIERVDLPQNKNYSFVEFAERAAARRAYAATSNQPVLGKRGLSVSYARSKTGDTPVDSASPKLWVSGIGKDTRKADIENIFGGFGKVTRIDAPPGKDFAFVWFDRVEDSEMAKRALHNKPIGGSVVRVTYSNKPDGAPKGRPKPATVTKCSPAHRDNTPPSGRIAGTLVSSQPSGEFALRPTWSDVLSTAKQSRLAAVVEFASVWSLWYDDPKSRGAPCVLGTFTKPPEFLEMLDQRVPRVLRGGSRLLLLRAGTPPSPRAVPDSGQVTVRVPSIDAPATWFWLMETILLEDLSFKDTLPGVVLERTGGQQGGTDSLVLWTDGLVDQVGVQTIQLAMAELRSTLRLQADISVTHQMHEAATPTKGATSTLAGGDPSWARGGAYTPTSGAGGACGASGGRWSPLSSASSSSSTNSHPATPLSTPLFIQRHSTPTGNANKLGHSATPGESVEKPIQLRPSHGLRPFGCRPPAAVTPATSTESEVSSPTATLNHQQQHITKVAAVAPSSAQPDRGPLQRPEHLRLKLQKATPKQLSDSVVVTQKRQSQPPQPSKSDPRETAQKNSPCSLRGQAARLGIAAPIASGIVTAAVGVLLYYAPAVGLSV